MLNIGYTPVKRLPILSKVLHEDSSKPYLRLESYSPTWLPLKGMIYSSVRRVGKYVGFNISLETFVSAITNPNSVVYTKPIKGTGQNVHNYYGTVCACFVSYVHDSHSHSDSSLFAYPDQKEKIEQGITTSVSGCCGISVAPVAVHEPKKNCYSSMGEFLKEGSKISLGSNMAVFVGHGAVRCTVMRMENRVPTIDELEKIKSLVKDAMENGALGLSLGLIYTPGCYANT